jgi:hypothetical protein
MKYMLLIHQGSSPTPRNPEAWERHSAEEQQAIYTDYRELTETRGVTPGLQLEPAEAGVTVRVRDGELLRTDGPFAETKEAIAGYLVYEADSLEQAVELAGRIPAARLGGAIEVRAVTEW